MEKKPLLSVFEKFILLGLVIFFGYNIFQKGGLTMMEKTEETTILDGNMSSKKYKEYDRKEKKVSQKKTSTKKLDTDDVLGNLARTFSKGRENTTRQMKEMGLSKDEIKYYKEVKKENNLTDKVKDAQDWFYVLKASASTYGKVKSLVNDLGKGSDDENVNAMLEDGTTSNDFYKKLESTFNISKEEAEAFANLGKKKVSDWARFIEEKTEEQ